MAELLCNSARTTLNGAIDNAQTTITVTNSTGFPNSGTFRIRIDAEIMTVTGVAANVWTVTRASEAVQGVQAAKAHGNLAAVAFRLTAGSLGALIAGGGGGSPGGATGNIQYNNSGAFAGNANLITNGSGSLTAVGNISSSGGTVTGTNLSGTNTGDQTAGAGILLTGSVLSLDYGHVNVWRANQTINLNAASAPTPSAGTGLQLVGVDATVARFESDAFGAIAAFTARRANGTGASPTAILSGDQIGSFGFQGYYVTGGPAYSVTQANMAGYAAENWTSTTLGTKVVIRTTPIGSTTLTDAATFGNDGSLLVAGTLTASNFSGSHSGTSSGTNTGDQTTISGNAATATALQTARNINGVSFNGTANITVTADASSLTGTTLNATVVTSSLTSVGTITTGVWSGTAIAYAKLALTGAILNADLAGSIAASKLVGTDITTVGTLSAGSVPFSLITSGTSTGVLTIAPAARSTLALPGLVYTGPADTGTTTLTERNSLLIDTSATVGWASGTGTLATQRNVLVKAPTYTCASAVTITTAGTLVIDKAPVAAGSITITNPYSLWIQAGTLAVSSTTHNVLVSHDGTNAQILSDTGNLILSALGTTTGGISIRRNGTAADLGFIAPTSGGAGACFGFGGFLCLNTNSAGPSISAGRGLILSGGAANVSPTSTIGMFLISTGIITWASGSTDANTTPDTGLARAAAGVINTTNASSGKGWLQNSAGRARNTADVTNATATMANLTDLSQTYLAGRKYFGFVLAFANNSTGAEGLQFDLAGGSATFTSIQFGFCGTPLGATLGTGSSTAAGTAITATVVSTSDVAYLIAVSFVVNAAGTVIPRGAEVSHTTGTATFRLGSFYLMEDSPN